MSKLPKWARKLHDEFCSWKCSDDRIQIAPKCSDCGKADPKSINHVGVNVLCPEHWNNALREAVY